MILQWYAFLKIASTCVTFCSDKGLIETSLRIAIVAADITDNNNSSESHKIVHNQIKIQ